MFVDTNILVRHLTGDPEEQAARASRFLADAALLLLPDLVVAEIVYVLASYYEASRAQVATALRSILAFDSIRVVDAALIHRALEVYELDRLDFPDAYLVACAERSGVATIASFDRSIDRIGTVRRIEPA
ncbi:MAG: PIN domain-containing protein [Chloroflexi bacterium]|nr:PIN domain-containing protein [Chloroflexota bacterium]